MVPGTIGTPARLHQLARAGLGAHRLDRGGGRPDEGDALLLERGREGGVLGQEAVAGVHGLGAGLLDHLEQLVDLEVGLGRRPGAQQVGLGGALDVLRVAVGLRVDGDGGDAELVERADDAHGDLSTVGDEDLAEHGGAPGYPAPLVRTCCRSLSRDPGSADPVRRCARMTRAVAAALLLVTAGTLLLRTGILDSGYWIDEAITVGIASHDLADIPRTLRLDGSPPLFYLLLHGWMALAGTGEAATRTLPLLFALLAVPVSWWAGTAVLDRRAGALAAAGRPAARS